MNGRPPPRNHVDPATSDTWVVLFTDQLADGDDPVYHLPIILRTLQWLLDVGPETPSGFERETLCGRHRQAHTTIAHLPLWAAVRFARLCRQCQRVAGILTTEQPDPRLDVPIRLTR